MYDFSEIIKGLTEIQNGVDPFTGEVFDNKELYNNHELCSAINGLYFIASGKKKPDSINRLGRPEEQIYDDLCSWRIDTARKKMIPAYFIFSNKELWNIARGDISKKEDLLIINGISEHKYNEYGEAIFDIIKKYIDSPEVKAIEDEPKNDRTNTANATNNPVKWANSKHTAFVREEKYRCTNCKVYKQGDCAGLGNPQECPDFDYIYPMTEAEHTIWRKNYGGRIQ